MLQLPVILLGLLAVLAKQSLGFFRGTSDRTQQTIIHTKLRDYNRNVLPPGIYRIDAPVKVKLGLALTMITELPNSKVQVDGWRIQEWNDPRLSWTSTFGNFSGNLHLSQDQIWVPDMALYNVVDLKNDVDRKHLAVVSRNGSVTIVDQFTTRIVCPEHSGHRDCALKYGSWTYDNSLINLQSRSSTIDVSGLVTMPGVMISDTAVNRNVVTYNCCPLPYTDLTFSFILVSA